MESSRSERHYVSAYVVKPEVQVTNGHIKGKPRKDSKKQDGHIDQILKV